MADASSVKTKIPINAKKPRDSGDLMVFLEKYQKVDENEIFLYMMADSHLLALVLANPVIFDTFRKMLGRTDETKYNRELLDIAIENNPELRYERVRSILCKLTTMQMAVLTNILVDTFNVYRAMKVRGQVCGDPAAVKMYAQLIKGIPDYPGFTDEADAARKGMMGTWRIDHNEVAGQMLVGLGEIEEKELITFIKQRDVNHKATRVDVHGCPICHGIYPEHKMRKARTKPYGTEAWICLTCINRETAKGEESIVYDVQEAVEPPAPTVTEEELIEDYADRETTGKLWKKPYIPPEKQAEAKAEIIERFPLPGVSIKAAVTENNAIIQAALTDIHVIMKEKKCSMQKAFEIWQEQQKTQAATSKLAKGIRKKGVQEGPGMISEKEYGEISIDEWKAAIDGAGSLNELERIEYMFLRLYTSDIGTSRFNVPRGEIWKLGKEGAGQVNQFIKTRRRSLITFPGETKKGVQEGPADIPDEYRPSRWSYRTWIEQVSFAESDMDLDWLVNQLINECTLDANHQGLIRELIGNARQQMKERREKSGVRETLEPIDVGVTDVPTTDRQEDVERWVALINDAQNLEALGDVHDTFIDEHFLDEQGLNQVEILFEDRRRALSGAKA